VTSKAFCLNEVFLVAEVLRGKLSQQSARKLLHIAGPVLAGDPDAVDPDSAHADRGCSETRVATRQVEQAPLRPAVYDRRIEEQQVGMEAGLERAALLHAEKLRWLPAQAPHRLG
jgi:hypothetical protein